MLSEKIRKFLVGLFVLTLLMTPIAAAQASAPTDAPIEGGKRGPSRLPAQTEALPTDRVIIQFKPSTSFSADDVDGQAQIADSLSKSAGVELTYLRPMSGSAHVLGMPEKQAFSEVQAVAQRLMERFDVEYAEPDQIFEHTLVPNDTYYSQQWHYFGAYGANLPTAWDITTGSSSVVVAVIDTGITNHADLSGRTVPGYDFISDTFVANDGGGRDSDPSDPGDWVTANQCYSGSSASNSSWHGTHVSGTIAANSNNSMGVAGVSWGARILPVRVLGKCGGYLSDIADGMRWAAGLYVYGVPTNVNPAKVLNLSLSGYGTSCSSTYQTAIDAIVAAGSSVVVSAGNSNYEAAYFQPANCNGVITVGATDIDGYITSYSNYGPTLEISAPGGDLIYDSGILSTLNSGTTVPAGDAYVAYEGTSMAAPHISGVIALMLSKNATLTPAQVLEVLQMTSRDFGNSWCNTTTNCGAGIVDAGAALNALKFYSWSGSAKITSSQSVVVVGRPHVGAEVASYGGLNSGSATQYVPMLFKNAFGGTYNAALYVQNQSASSASLTMQFIDGSGAVVYTKNDTLAANASKGYWLPAEAGLPSGFAGGVKVTASQNILAVGRPHIGSQVMTYNGVSAGATTNWLPMFFKNGFGSYNTALYVQNVTASIANLTIQYINLDGTVACTDTDTLGANASKGYWSLSVACDTGSLPAGFVGGVKVTSTQNILAVGRAHLGTQITTYNGFAGGATTAYVPMLFRNAFGGSYDAALYLQNVSGSSANIAIEYLGSDGSVAATQNVTLGAGAISSIWLPSVAGLADGFAGGARITSAQNVIAVGRPHLGSEITAYNGTPSGGVNAYLPMLFKDAYGGSYDAAFYVQNTNTSSSASVTINFYDTDGNLSCTRTDTISPRATLGYWLPTVACQ